MIRKLFATGLVSLILLFFSLWTSLVINFIALYVIWNAFTRITTFSTSKNLAVNTSMIRLHLISYALFIISFLSFLVANVVSGQKYVSAFTNLVALTNLISQCIEAFIFLSICDGEAVRVNGKSRALTKSASQYTEPFIET